MLANSFLLLVSAALSLASPTQYSGGAGCSPRPNHVLPFNGGARELPSPPAGVTLKHVALGFGIQNYTCADVAAQPLAQGAVAMLYDITKLYPSQNRKSLDHSAWEFLTSQALAHHKVPLNLNPGGVGASSTKPFPKDKPLKLEGYGKFPFIGHHYFDAAGVPVFDFPKTDEVLIAKKLDGIKAPATADVGPEGTGAVDWLYLGDAGGSIGVTYVYRVYTAGGSSHGCQAKGTDSTSYTTMYWFYG